MGLDKFMAMRGGRRIPEARLLVFSAFGMAPGLLFGMLFFKHKTSKKSFVAGAFFALLTSIAVYFLAWWAQK
jgi:uncharacterized membrane protein YsdA (DUF1294 family)